MVVFPVLVGASVNPVVAGVALERALVHLTVTAVVGMAYIAATSQYGGLLSGTAARH